MTKKITFGALVCAMGTALLYVGGIIDVASMSLAALAGMLIIVIRPLELGRYNLMIYAATALLSLLLTPEKSGTVLYAVFFGLYPVISVYIDMIGRRWLRLLVKLVTFNVLFFVVALIFVTVFSEPIPEIWACILIILAANAFFLLYDKAIFSAAAMISRRIFKK